MNYEATLFGQYAVISPGRMPRWSSNV